MKLLIIGSPGAGKGTQAKIISKKFNIAHISTGDLLRDELAMKTPLGLEISNIINSGQLVSDEIVEKLLSKRIEKDDCKNGFILDGYPRNVTQAKSLKSIVGEIDKVILIVVPDEVIIERMTGRMSCLNCGQMYHIKNNPPKKEGICDECGEKLVQRDDDKVETVKKRLEVYHSATSPIISYYKEKGNNTVVEINGTESIDHISEKIVSILRNE